MENTHLIGAILVVVEYRKLGPFGKVCAARRPHFVGEHISLQLNIKEFACSFFKENNSFQSILFVPHHSIRLSIVPQCVVSASDSTYLVCAAPLTVERRSF